MANTVSIDIDRNYISFDIIRKMKLAWIAELNPVWLYRRHCDVIETVFQRI